MTNGNHAEAQRWLAQAADDLEAARCCMDGGVFPHSCFWAQQASEKALKAFLIFHGERDPRGHACVRLLDAAVDQDASLEPLRDACRRLDLLTIPTRYPNGLPGGTARDVFGRGQAEEALRLALSVHDAVIARIGPAIPRP